MGDYQRSTRACTMDDMNSALSAAVLAHVQKHDLGELGAPACWETSSTKQKKGLFGGKPEVYLTSLVLSPPWFIWATEKEGEVLGVHSAKLRDLQIQDYEKSDLYKLVQDTGLNLSGLRTDSTDTGSVFVGLGPEAEAEDFRARLKAAIASA